MGDHLPPSDEGELWLDVVGYEGLYQVSNQARVWSVDRKDRRGKRIGGKLLTASVEPESGYHRVSLTSKDQRHGVRTVRQLVMLAHVGPPPEGQQVCNGPRRLPDGSSDDRLDNLRYDWIGAARRNDRIDQLRDEICQAFAAGQSSTKIAERFGFGRDLVKKRIRQWGATGTHLRPCTACGQPTNSTTGICHRPECFNAAQRASRNADPLRMAMHNAKQRARRFEVPFSLTVDTIPPIPAACPIDGRELRHDFNGRKAARADSPSLDRIEPGLGYVPENVRWLCMSCNTRKSDRIISDEELRAEAADRSAA